ncbi:MAG TPA: RNA polymerase sigma factor region1.1 domain-containing protein, partial [Steroidobacteraceae bacterium]|nr:RNA polymerase sigma factor region1.1 domain-containing protein [Steroidobacteraceae bacterium]
MATDCPESYTCRLAFLNVQISQRGVHLIKKAPAGTATQIADERQSQLKLLIARGKEQGYLTYAEVNDHLPSE